jgi:hypothetical protein
LIADHGVGFDGGTEGELTRTATTSTTSFGRWTTLVSLTG